MRVCAGKAEYADADVPGDMIAGEHPTEYAVSTHIARRSMTTKKSRRPKTYVNCSSLRYLSRVLREHPTERGRCIPECRVGIPAYTKSVLSART